MCRQNILRFSRFHETSVGTVLKQVSVLFSNKCRYCSETSVGTVLKQIDLREEELQRKEKVGEKERKK
jgi:hypothetical protein